MIRDNKRKVDIQIAANALESFKTDSGQYYHFSDYSFSDDNFLQTLQEGGIYRLLFDDIGTCPITDMIKTKNNYLTKPLKDPINDNTHMYYYFADTYQVNDCYGDLYSNLMPSIKKVFPKLEGCLEYGECSGGKVVSYNNLFGDSCFGKDSNKSIYILATNLETEDHDIKDIVDIFSFCPTSDFNNSGYKDFKEMTYYFNKIRLNYFIILEDIVDYWYIEKPPKK